MKHELIQMYVDTVTMLEGKIDDYEVLSTQIKKHFNADVSAEELEHFFCIEVQDKLIHMRNMGINY
jgi:hypothetical protein